MKRDYSPSEKYHIPPHIPTHLQIRTLLNTWLIKFNCYYFKSPETLTLRITLVAEEITQIVFMKLWEKFDTVSDSESLKGYMFSIARNTLLNYLKHETIEYIYYNYLRDVSHEDHTTQDAIDSAFLNQYVSTLIDELPPVRQKVFKMSRIQYLTNRQISQALGISVSTVETHLTLALKFMRQELKRRYGIICDFIIIATMLSCHI